MIPRFEDRFQNGAHRVVFCWLGWEWPISRWVRPRQPIWWNTPADLPSGVQYPVEPEHDGGKASAVESLMGQPGWDVLARHWEWKSKVLAWRCVLADRRTVDRETGRFQGFIEARALAERLKNWSDEGGGVTDEEWEYLSHQLEMMKKYSVEAVEY